MDEWGKDPIIDKVHIAGTLLMTDAFYDLGDGLHKLASVVEESVGPGMESLDLTFTEVAQALHTLADKGLFEFNYEVFQPPDDGANYVHVEELTEEEKKAPHYTALPETGETPSVVGPDGVYVRLRPGARPSWREPAVEDAAEMLDLTEADPLGNVLDKMLEEAKREPTTFEQVHEHFVVQDGGSGEAKKDDL